MAWDISQKLDEQSKKLRQIAASTGLTAGAGGFKYHGTGNFTDVQYSALVPQENTEFTSFKVNGVERLTANGMGSVVFKQFAYLPGGGIITGFAISQGSVIGYK
jgi:hypothetical protein